MKTTKKETLRIIKAEVSFSFASSAKTNWHKDIIQNKLKDFGAHDIKIKLKSV